MSDRRILLNIAKKAELKEQFCNFLDTQETLNNVISKFKKYREKLLQPPIKDIEEIDFYPLIEILENYMERNECPHNSGCNCETIIFETCLKTFFGDDVFDYISEVWDTEIEKD